MGFSRDGLSMRNGVFGLNGWLYGEQVKEYQMWVTSSLPSQHNKADLIINQILKKSIFFNA